MKRLLTLGFIFLATWTSAAQRQPKDQRPMQIRVAGRELAVVYQYRIEFVHLDDSIRYKIQVAGAQFRRGPGDPKELGEIGEAAEFEKRQPDGSFVPIEISTLRPHKIWRFKYNVRVGPQVAPMTEKTEHLMVCSNPLHHKYSAAHNDEEAEHMPDPYHTMIWVNPKGTISDTCRVIDHSGRVVYEFPIKQKLPGPLAEALVTTGDGRRAGIMVGSAIEEEGPDSIIKSIGNFTEVWIWSAPNKLKKIRPKKPNKFFARDEKDYWINAVKTGKY